MTLRAQLKGARAQREDAKRMLEKVQTCKCESNTCWCCDRRREEESRYRNRIANSSVELIETKIFTEIQQKVGEIFKVLMDSEELDRDVCVDVARVLQNKYATDADLRSLCPRCKEPLSNCSCTNW